MGFHQLPNVLLFCFTNFLTNIKMHVLTISVAARERMSFLAVAGAA
jgi:hypothetical protein